jgi:hypothetical protein
MNTGTSYFWRIVVDCLESFHGRDTAAALDLVRQFRTLLREAPAEIDTELIFHEEPFALAARLAGSTELVPSQEQEARYREILRKRMEEAVILDDDRELHAYTVRGRRAAETVEAWLRRELER